MVCLKHVGITDWVRERLKMSGKTLSADALITHPGNLSGLVNVNLFKGFAHISYGSAKSHSHPEQLVRSCMVQCCLP